MQLTQIYSGDPIRITIEASLQAIIEYDLDTFEGEQFDHIDNVISITNDGRAHTIETTRSWEAFRRGVPNAGRGTWVIPNESLHKIHLPDNNDDKEQA